MNKQKIVSCFIIVIVISVLFFFVLFLSITMTNQEKKYSTNDSCEQLKECILLELYCLDRHIVNKFLVWEWEFNDKALFFEQRDYYKKNCYDIRIIDKSRKIE